MAWAELLVTGHGNHSWGTMLNTTSVCVSVQTGGQPGWHFMVTIHLVVCMYVSMYVCVYMCMSNYACPNLYVHAEVRG